MAYDTQVPVSHVGFKTTNDADSHEVPDIAGSSQGPPSSFEEKLAVVVSLVGPGSCSQVADIFLHLGTGASKYR
jgi:hypothetical protein